MNDARQDAHRLIDRLPETQFSALAGLLETIVDPVGAALRDAPMDDEPETDEEKQELAEARACLQREGGRGIPHEEAMRRLGLKRERSSGPRWRSITWPRPIKASPAGSSRPSSGSPMPARAT